MKKRASLISLVTVAGWVGGYGLAWAVGPCPGSIVQHAVIAAIPAPAEVPYKFTASTPDTPRPYRTASRSKFTAWSNATCIGAFENAPAARVTIRAGNYGTNFFGFTQRTSANTLCDSSYTISYERANLEAWPSSETYDTACHEEGHTLGLGEGTGTTGCMGSGGQILSSYVNAVNATYQGHSHVCR